MFTTETSLFSPYSSQSEIQSMTRLPPDPVPHNVCTGKVSVPSSPLKALFVTSCLLSSFLHFARPMPGVHDWSDTNTCFDLVLGEIRDSILNIYKIR